MPIYEYRCTSCEHVYEELVPRADSPAPPCPKCASAEAEKLMSVFSGHVGSPRMSCASGPTCPSASGGGCRSCPMTGV